MPTLETIKKQLNDCGASDFFGTKKEVKELPDEIQDDEVIKYATSGMLDANTYLMVCTNKRVIFLDKGMIYGLKKVVVPLDKVNSVSFKKGLIMGEITIYHGSSEMKIGQVDKKTVTKMAETIQEQVDLVKQKDSKSQSNDDMIEQLKKLKELVDMEVITEEEFKAKKAKVLGI